MRINEIVERSRLLPGSQNQVAPSRQLHPVLVLPAEEIVLFVLMFPRLAGVDRDPSVASQIEFGPAMISCYIRFTSLVREREPNREPSRYSGGSRQPNEQRMKIRAVPA